MKNSFGQSVCLTIFGESHGAAVGCVIDGLAPGIKVDEDFIARQLTRRRPSSALDTPRQEKDEFKIISGVFSDRTTGTPLTIVIPNENTISRDYNYGPARPAHADFSAYCKRRLHCRQKVQQLAGLHRRRTFFRQDNRGARCGGRRYNPGARGHRHKPCNAHRKVRRRFGQKIWRP